ncbi:AAA family ATPase [Modestobacter sp. URMC 112]
MPSPATLVLLVGLPGSGKTTRARELERTRGALRLTPDEWMLPLFGAAEAGDRRDVLEGRLIWVALRAVELGTDVVLDFGLWSRQERAALRWLAAAVGADCTTTYLPVDPDTQLQRVRDRYAAGPGTEVALTPAELRSWRERFQPPTDDELTGAVPTPLPAGHASWSSWAATRWPSLPDAYPPG